eukprot:gene26713-biopygen4697
MNSCHELGVPDRNRTGPRYTRDRHIGKTNGNGPAAGSASSTPLEDTRLMTWVYQCLRERGAGFQDELNTLPGRPPRPPPSWGKFCRCWHWLQIFVSHHTLHQDYAE